MRKLFPIASAAAVLVSTFLIAPAPASAHAAVRWAGLAARGEINSSHTTALACKMGLSIEWAQVDAGSLQIRDFSHDGRCVSGRIPSGASTWRVCYGGGPDGNFCLAYDAM